MGDRPRSLIVVRDPSRHRDETRAICRICKAVYWLPGEQRAFDRHVVDCFDRNEQEVRDRSLRIKNPLLFDPLGEGGDDLAQWMRRNRQAVLDGKLKP
jgi:hypothetical protein